ncbi:DegT/DnrJ/EryC1/StrS family aminotransferase [Candidatus Woesearchaeota archaeon]|nr:DegT/DnrJ/EryC1/StrS family aminotransferase [Candidatus Woesearchaeota archaeon]
MVNIIPVAKPDLSGKEGDYLAECIRSGWISSAGPFIQKFEQAFAEFCEVRYATSCSNGTVALHLALLALGIGKDDEVIVPDLTFAATANAVLFCGAQPVLADVDKETWNLNGTQVEKKISKRTRAIIPVHLYGNPCPMDEIMMIAKKYKLWVIEDCAESPGATYRGKKVGSIGHIGCFSFYGNKIITTGEGGMCVSSDKEVIDKINILKNHGMKPGQRYWHDIVGYNYRMTNMQAAVGLAQLERFSRFLGERNRIKEKYLQLLGKKSWILPQKTTMHAQSVPWLFSVMINLPQKTPAMVLAQFSKKNIEARRLFYPLHGMPPYQTADVFHNADYISDHGISLPTYIGMKDEDLHRICQALEE